MLDRWRTMLGGAGSPPVPPTPPIGTLTMEDLNPIEPLTIVASTMARECGIIETEQMRFTTVRFRVEGMIAGSPDPMTVVISIPGYSMLGVIALMQQGYLHWASQHAHEDGEI